MIARWATAALASTAALLLLGGVLRGYGPALGHPEALEHSRRMAGLVLAACAAGVAGTALWRHRRSPRLLWASLAAFAGVGAQGWLGTRPVAPGARPLVLAGHLLLTLLLAGLWLFVRGAAVPAASAGGPATPPTPPAPGSGPPDPAPGRRLALLAALACAAAALQIVVGAQVRGQLDLVVLGEPDLPRGAWLAELGPLPAAHHTLAAIVGALLAAVVLLARRLPAPAPGLRPATAAALFLCLAQWGLGLALTAGALPPAAQALHLPGAVLLWGALFVVWQQARRPSGVSAPAASTP